MPRLTRRGFCAAASVTAAQRQVSVRRTAAWSFASSKRHGDPFGEIEVDVILEDLRRRALRIPGGNPHLVHGLEAGVSHRSYFWNLVNAKEHPK